MATPKSDLPTDPAKPVSRPRGAAPDGTGPVPVTDWGAIQRAAQEQKSVSAVFAGQPFAFRLSALSGAEWDKADSFEDIEPPMLPGGDGFPQFNYTDKGFLEARRRGSRLKSAYIIDTGLVDLTLEGDTIEAKSDWLRSNFPVNLRVFLEEQITSLSADPIKLANFSTSGA